MKVWRDLCSSLGQVLKLNMPLISQICVINLSESEYFLITRQSYYQNSVSHLHGDQLFVIEDRRSLEQKDIFVIIYGYVSLPFFP